MPLEVEVGTIVHPFELAKAHGEFVLDIPGVFRVMGELVRTMLVPAELVHANTVFLVKSPALFAPEIEPLHVFAGFHEKLHLHLLEFACTENEVLGDDFVPERLAYLRNPERNLEPVRLGNILVVYINTLCGLRAEDYGVR